MILTLKKKTVSKSLLSPARRLLAAAGLRISSLLNLTSTSESKELDILEITNIVKEDRGLPVSSTPNVLPMVTAPVVVDKLSIATSPIVHDNHDNDNQSVATSGISSPNQQLL